MNSLCRAIAQSRRTGSYPLRFLLQSSFSFSSSYSSTTTITRATPSEISIPKSPSLPSSSDWPKPREIPFQAKVANSISLIGYVTEPVEFLTSPDGNHWATTVFSQQSSPSRTPLWIPIIFEGDLAHVAASHIKKNDHIYIAGQLSTTPPIDVIQGQTPLLIMVRDINFVQVSSEITKSHGCWQQEGFSPKQNAEQQKEKTLKDYDSVKKYGDFGFDSWKDLLDNPKQWWDYRNSKLSGLTNPKHPDFKRKDGSMSLWLNRAPAWILSELEKMEFDVQVPRSKQVKKHKGDESWKNLVENTNKWWDNRLNKRNVKAPDFKHKETGEALWLNDAPTWVLPELPPIKSEQNVAAGRRDTLLS
ncbi:hypothetical protein JCGZ_19727 [Jatropha curcas]|uniref:Uncharacterized protein n=1 Tax=Jatropha curcas TaxID=180498 RepID=A0A067JY20_JATCU|nr:protein OSB2, chloroplastic [Jatropha curcas]KDP27688.1 hypothetical protein JCGZ_19727 [Jatropha curcas]